jgi:putative phosphoribosyl transferase
LLIKTISIEIKNQREQSNLNSNEHNLSLQNNSAIEGILTIPSKNTKGIVIFSHGSGSGRHSVRNQNVAKILNQSDIATLLLDLLTPKEEKIDNQTKEFRFNIGLISERLDCAIDYIKNNFETKDFDVGIFGASTGAASALIISANKKQDIVKAIVSRGGRVDLALKYCDIKNIRVPSLFIVGEKDSEILNLNKKVFELLTNINIENKKIVIIPGATHLFEEPGKLEQVSRHASSWFKKYLIN